MPGGLAEAGQGDHSRIVSSSVKENLPGAGCALAPGLTLTLMFHGTPSSAQTCLRSPIHTQLPIAPWHCQEALSSPGWQHRACSEGKPRSDHGKGFRAGSSTANTGRDGFQESLSRESLLTGSVVSNDLSRSDPIMGEHWAASEAGFPHPIPCQSPPDYSSRSWEWLVFCAHSRCHPTGHRGRGQFPCPPDARQSQDPALPAPSHTGSPHGCGRYNQAQTAARVKFLWKCSICK